MSMTQNDAKLPVDSDCIDRSLLFFVIACYFSHDYRTNFSLVVEDVQIQRDVFEGMYSERMNR